ncbi:hypothetical protein D3C76_980680 [compost metagenome]
MMVTPSPSISSSSAQLGLPLEHLQFYLKFDLLPVGSLVLQLPEYRARRLIVQQAPAEYIPSVFDKPLYALPTAGLPKADAFLSVNKIKSMVYRLVQSRRIFFRNDIS